MGSAKDSIVTADELRSHNNPSDLWISIQGKVYDVTQWSKEHPGGDLPLLHLAGQDVTDAFVAYHPASAWAHLDRFLVGRFADYWVSPASKDYRRLLADFSKAGLFDRKGHEHAAPPSTASRRSSPGTASPGSASPGGSGTTTPTTHIACNSLEFDPDLQHICTCPSSPSPRASSPRQHPALDLLPGHVPRQAQPLRAVALPPALPPQPGAAPPPGDPRGHRSVLDLVPAAGLLLPPDLARAGRVRAGQLLGHRRPARAVLPQPLLLCRLRRPAPRGNDWFEKQTEGGTLNIVCPPWMDWFHGGLQFQVEHHLFPRLPTCHLRTVAPLVRDLCRKHGLPYATAGFLEANCRTVRVLRNAALQARDLSRSVPKNLVWEAVNTHG